MSIPYERVKPETNAVLAIQKTLQAFGCQAFGSMIDNDRQTVTVAFRWNERQVQLEANWGGYARLLVNKSGWKHDDAVKHAQKAVYSILRDWVKGQTTAIECGVMDFETAFLPHMLLKDGRRLIDVAAAAGILPSDGNKHKVVALPNR